MTSTKTNFFIGEVIGIGWQAWRRQPLQLSGIVAAALLIPYLPATIGMALGDEAGWLTVFLLLGMWGLAFLINLGLLRVSLKVTDGQPVQWLDLFAEWRLLPRLGLATGLYLLVVLGGCLMFIIPGIVWAIGLQYYPWLILEGYGPVAALQESARLTVGHKWDLLAWHWVSQLIIILGIFSLGLGLLVAMPVVLVANTALYRCLQAIRKEVYVRKKNEKKCS